MTLRKYRPLSATSWSSGASTGFGWIRFRREHCFACLCKSTDQATPAPPGCVDRHPGIGLASCSSFSVPLFRQGLDVLSAQLNPGSPLASRSTRIDRSVDRDSLGADVHEPIRREVLGVRGQIQGAAQMAKRKSRRSTPSRGTIRVRIYQRFTIPLPDVDPPVPRRLQQQNRLNL